MYTIDKAGCVPGTLERPHRSSFFLPGKLKRQPVHFLIDTGCNTNLLLKRVFDHLPERVRNQLEENDAMAFLLMVAGWHLMGSSDLIVEPGMFP